MTADEKREKRLSDKTKKTASGMKPEAMAKTLSPAKKSDGFLKKTVLKVGDKLHNMFGSTTHVTDKKTNTELLGEIFSQLKIMEEDKKLNQQLVNNHIEEEEQKKNDRNEEIIKALTGRKLQGKKGDRSKRREQEKKTKEVKPKSEKKPAKPTTPTTPVTTPTVPTPSAASVVSRAAASVTAKQVAGAAVIAGGLGAAIARGESANASYNAANKGTQGNKIIGVSGKLDLENMTIGEVMRRQAIKWGAPNESEKLFAVGKYQMIPETLADAVKTIGGISMTDKFDGKLQERMFTEYLLGKKRPAIAKYLNSPVDDPKLLHDALKQLSLEWASIADPDIPGGKTSHYGNGNKASLTVDDAAKLLKQDREKAQTKKTEVPVVAPAIPDVSKISSENTDLKKQVNAQSQQQAVKKDTTNNYVTSKQNHGQEETQKEDDRPVPIKKAQ